MLHHGGTYVGKFEDFLTVTWESDRDVLSGTYRPVGETNLPL